MKRAIFQPHQLL